MNWWLSKLDIIYSGNQSGKGLRPKKRTALEYVKINAVRSSVLKKKLIEEGFKESKCEECDLSEWNNKPIPTELHHKDGNRFNNDLLNLQVLCCNCHAQTLNYKKKKGISIKYYCECGIEKQKRSKQCLGCRKKELSNKKEKNNKNFCKCGKLIKKLSKNCVECQYKKQRKVKRPNYKKLIEEVKKTNYSAVGRKYGVSDNAIRKWINAGVM